MKKVMKRRIMALAVASIVSCVYAVKKEIDPSIQQFHTMIGGNKYALVLFYQPGDAHKDEFLAVAKTAKNNQYLRQKGVRLYELDMSDVGNARVAESLQLKRVPTFVLFRRGSIVLTRDGRPAQFFNLAGSYTLQQFVAVYVKASEKGGQIQQRYSAGDNNKQVVIYNDYSDYPYYWRYRRPYVRFGLGYGRRSWGGGWRRRDWRW